MAAHKGHKKAGGRQKGTPNKATAEIRDMLRQALDESGGVEYFVKQAKENPVSFNTLIAKIIPADINAKLTGNITIKVVRFGE
jgi:hypothetical protein